MSARVEPDVSCKSLVSSVMPNNGMHPTRIRPDVIRQLGCLSHCIRAGDAGRWAASLSVRTSLFSLITYPQIYNKTRLSGIFSDSEATKIVEILEAIKQNAVA